MTTLGIFAKAPVPGQVKTRLAADAGDRFAAQVADAFVRDVVARSRIVAFNRRVIAYSPPSGQAQRFFRSVANEAGGAADGAPDELWPQPEGSLGDRLAAFFEHFTKPPDAAAESRTIVIGTDSPVLPLVYLEDALRQLEHHDVVLGPASDGGYYLIGLKRPCGELFCDIDWDSSSVLEQTLERVEQQKLAPALLPVWNDVDTAADLVVLTAYVASCRIAGIQTHSPFTERVVLGERP